MISRAKLGIAVLAAGLAVGVDTAKATSTLSFRSRGVSVVDLQNFPLADGTTTQIFKVRTMNEVTDGDFKGEVWGGECYGSGSVSLAGEYSGVVRCSVSITADDGYAFQVDHDTAEGASFTVTGGKGKFAGVTGSGAYTYYWGDAVFGDRLAWTNEVTLQMP